MHAMHFDGFVPSPGAFGMIPVFVVRHRASRFLGLPFRYFFFGVFFGTFAFRPPLVFGPVRFFPFLLGTHSFKT